jgi:hypothetical protein
MNERTPYDGQPYYCMICGLGFGEFIACEEVDCILEDSARAIARAEEHNAIRTPTDGYSYQQPE